MALQFVLDNLTQIETKYTNEKHDLEIVTSSTFAQFVVDQEKFQQSLTLNNLHLVENYNKGNLLLKGLLQEFDIDYIKLVFEFNLIHC